jgi:hypothetical protein
MWNCSVIFPIFEGNSVLNYDVIFCHLIQTQHLQTSKYSNTQ